MTKREIVNCKNVWLEAVLRIQAVATLKTMDFEQQKKKCKQLAVIALRYAKNDKEKTVAEQLLAIS